MSNDPKTASLVPLSPRPPESEPAEQDLRLIKAQADANISVIRETATQVKTVVDTPGVTELLKGVGQRLTSGDPEVLARLKNEHERAMQADRLQAEHTRRRDVLGLAVLSAAALVVVSVIVAVSVLAANGVITSEKATAIAGVVIALLTAFGVGRKTKSEK